MKLIENKNDKVNLVWGNKYKLKGYVGDLQKSDIVLLVSDGIDDDGEVEIATKYSSTWVEPDYLQEIDQTSLEDVVKKDITFSIEINPEELEILERSLSYLIDVGYGNHEADSKYNILLKEIEDILVIKEVKELLDIAEINKK